MAMRLPTAPTQRGWQEHAAATEKKCSAAAFGSRSILRLSADSETRHSSLAVLKNSTKKKSLCNTGRNVTSFPTLLVQCDKLHHVNF